LCIPFKIDPLEMAGLASLDRNDPVESGDTPGTALATA